MSLFQIGFFCNSLLAYCSTGYYDFGGRSHYNTPARKNMENLKNENQRLKDENGALIRVISKLSK